MGEKVQYDSALLKISSSTFFEKFLHNCCDEIIEGKQIDAKTYNNDDIELTSEDIKNAKIIIKDHFYKYIIHGRTEKLEMISEAASESMQKCLETRRHDLELHLLRTAFFEAGHNLLEDVDYKLKWILGNSMLPGYRESILQLHLGCSRNSFANSEPKYNILDIELNIEKVDYMINVLENALKELSENN